MLQWKKLWKIKVGAVRKCLKLNKAKQCKQQASKACMNSPGEVWWQKEIFISRDFHTLHCLGQAQDERINWAVQIWSRQFCNAVMQSHISLSIPELGRVWCHTVAFWICWGILHFFSGNGTPLAFQLNSLVLCPFSAFRNEHFRVVSR